MGLIGDYLSSHKKYKEIYGEKTAVLLQCGSFYEVYGLKNKQTGSITGSDIVEVANILDLAIANKNTGVGSNVSSDVSAVMAGFGLTVKDKYTKKLVDAGYTVAIIDQDQQTSGTTRSLSEIISPGTDFNTDTPKLSNNICCIWIETTDIKQNNKYSNIVTCGMVSVDIYTGKVFINEFSNEYLHNPATFDELERFISIYNPCETIIIHNLETRLSNDIVSFANIRSKKIHNISLREDADNSGTVKEQLNNCQKQTYQQNILENYYSKSGNEMNNVFEDIYRTSLCCQAFCYLLNFLRDSNTGLVKDIQCPIYEKNSKHLLAANHSLMQLNILNDNNHTGKYSSLVDLLNNCITPMGKRIFNHMILHPITDENKLRLEYDIVEYMLNDKREDELAMIKTSLTTIRDLEKLNRRIVMQSIHPGMFYDIHSNMTEVKNLYKFLNKSKDKSKDKSNDKLSSTDINLSTYLENQHDIKGDFNKLANKIAKQIDAVLDLKVCKDIRGHNTDVNYIKKGIYDDLDIIVEQWYDNEDILEAIRKYFNDVVGKFENKNKKTKTKTNSETIGNKYVTIHSTEKSGNYLMATTRRVSNLQKELFNKGIQNVDIEYTSSYSGEQKIYTLKVDDIVTDSATASNKSIKNQQIDILCKNVLTSKSRMVSAVEVKYKDFVTNIASKLIDDIQIISTYISALDVIQNKCYVAKKYNYCKPEISYSEDQTKSFLDCRKLRHPLIEHINTDEIYVANDVTLGKQDEDGGCDGMLVYGTNAVGKTSLIRAVGISVIMAQAGMYVPCESFVFKPYEHIFTRILGNDNIFKGLSTFAVEMSELRTILRQSTPNSLILGDELCSGTEIESATAIFTAGVCDLHERGSSFMFATHFHQITDRIEITRCDNLKLVHMAVRFDREKDILIYDRILRDGPGDKAYGLEVCKSLSLPDDFLKYAHELRKKYEVQEEDMLLQKPSSYNSKKLKGGKCEDCGAMLAKEVHHMQPQKDSDENGYITSNSGSFHKNNPANLMNLCHDCHLNKYTKTNKKMVRKKTTGGFILEEV